MMVISLDSAAPRAALGLGREAARAIGHLPLLLVLRIDEGTPVELAPDAIAFIVTDGLLVSDRASLAGPGDVVMVKGSNGSKAHLIASALMVGASKKGA